MKILTDIINNINIYKIINSLFNKSLKLKSFRLLIWDIESPIITAKNIVGDNPIKVVIIYFIKDIFKKDKATFCKKNGMFTGERRKIINNS